MTKCDVDIKSNIASLLGKRCRFEMMKKADKDKDVVIVQEEINEKEVPQLILQEELEMKYQGITIHKNKKCDTWYTRYRVGGKQYYISARTQKECLEKLKKAMYNKKREYFMSQSEENRNNSITLIEWYNKWLNLYKVGKVSDETMRDYRSLMRNIDTCILNKPIKNITLEEILRSINECNGGRQKQKLYDLFNMLFSKAEDNEIISKNIIKRIDKPKHEKEHSQALTNDQQKILIDTALKIENGVIILIAMYQGLRRGEVLGLTLDNIDFEKNTLEINKAWSQQNNFTHTKNKQSQRIMPLFEESKKLMLNYIKSRQGSGRVFDLSTKQYEKLIQTIKEQSKIDNLKMKDMRATFITRCKELNIPEHIIQSWVGHQIGSGVTRTVYTRHNKDIDDKYINILNESKFYSNSTHF